MDVWMNMLTLVLFLYLMRQCFDTKKALSQHFLLFEANLDQPETPLVLAYKAKLRMLRGFTFACFLMYL